MLEAIGRVDRASLAGYASAILGRVGEVADEVLAVRMFEVAGLRVRLRCTDPALAGLYATRVGRPVDGDAGTEDLRADVLETSRLGWAPSARWADSTSNIDAIDGRLEGTGLKVAPPYAPGLWEVMAVAPGAALQLVDRVGDLPPWEAGAPLRFFLHWSLLRRGWRLLHGATLGQDGRGVVLAGAGGVGKSGTTLAGLAHGLCTVGDDYVAVAPGNPPVASSVYRILKLDPEGIARVLGPGAPSAGAALNWQGKIELDPEALFPGQFVPRLQLTAILIPDLRLARKSRLEPIPRAEALRALAASTLEQLPGDRGSGLLFCAGLTARLPAYRLVLSEDAGDVAATIRGAIAREARP